MSEEPRTSRTPTSVLPALPLPRRIAPWARPAEIIERATQDELLQIRNDLMTVYREVEGEGPELFPLLHEQRFPCADGLIAFAEELHVLNEGLNLNPCGAHTLHQLDPAARLLVVIPDPALVAGYRRNEADPFIIAQGVGRQTVFLARLCDCHNIHLPGLRPLLSPALSYHLERAPCQGPPPSSAVRVHTRSTSARSWLSTSSPNPRRPDSSIRKRQIWAWVMASSMAVLSSQRR